MEKKWLAEGHGYSYNAKLFLFFGIVDDIIGVTKAGLDAVKMNIALNNISAEKPYSLAPKNAKPCRLEKIMMI